MKKLCYSALYCWLKASLVTGVYLWLTSTSGFTATIPISDGDNDTGWTVTDALISSPTINNTIKIQGSGSIQFNIFNARTNAQTKENDWAEIVYRPTYSNWSEAELISFWLYLDLPARGINILELRVEDQNSNYSKWIFYYKTPIESWQYYTFRLDSPSESSVTPITLSQSVITQIKIRVQHTLSPAPVFNLFIDDVRLYYGFSQQFVSKLETTCTDLQAKEEIAAQSFISQEIAPWVDIAKNITPADRARGFVEIGVRFTGANDARWIFIGDDDSGSYNDLRALADGVPYELKDVRYKTSELKRNVVYPLGNEKKGAKSGSSLVLEFNVPRRIEEFYKIFLGVGNLQPALESYYNLIGSEYKYILPYWQSTSYRGEVYIIPPLPGIYADFEMTDLPEKAYWQYDKVRKKFDYINNVWELPVGVDIEFDAAPSVSYLSSAITNYTWDLAGDIRTGQKVTKSFPEGQYTVSLTVDANNLTFPEHPFARKSVTINVVKRPTIVDLYQNGPNPFELFVPNALTRIKYQLSENTKVNLGIYDLSGKLVKTLIKDKSMPAGTWEIEWDGKNEDKVFVNTGVYIYVLKTAAKTLYRKMLVVK